MQAYSNGFLSYLVIVFYPILDIDMMRAQTRQIKHLSYPI